MDTIQVSIESRYLVPFNLKRIPHAYTDILIIGGGISGTRAALGIDPHLDTIVVTKDIIDHSNSAWAQGGIAGVLDPADATANHVADTITAGKGLCNQDVVNHVINAAPQLIRELVNFGAQFDHDGAAIALTQEGGHSHRRIVHALGDATGREIMRALINEVRNRSNIQIWEKTFTIDLLTHQNRCVGAIVWNPHHGKTFIWAKQTILATGGAGQMYRESTNPEIATADGHALAFRAGAVVCDMEMMQFHPTVLYIAGGSRHLISEAVRGEGAYLRNSRGERFMPDYHELAELAPRDEVSLAITDQMEKTQHPCVYLDLKHLEKSLITQRFPNIAKVCARFGLDLSSDLIPVRPGAHYMIGGVKVDLNARTSLQGLWAAGEVTSSGLHGANRLASNSLLEGLYYGKLAGEGASFSAINVPDVFTAWPVSSENAATQIPDSELNILDLRNSLTSVMSRKNGIVRNAWGMLEALDQVQFWDRYVSRHTFSTVDGWELQNMLLVARLMLTSALQRTESRGVHFRKDYPETSPDWLDHISLVSKR